MCQYNFKVILFSNTNLNDDDDKDDDDDNDDDNNIIIIISVRHFFFMFSYRDMDTLSTGARTAKTSLKIVLPILYFRIEKETGQS